MIEIEALTILLLVLGGTMVGLYALLNRSTKVDSFIETLKPHKSEAEIKKEAAAERERIAAERRKRYEV